LHARAEAVDLTGVTYPIAKWYEAVRFSRLQSGELLSSGEGFAGSVFVMVGFRGGGPFAERPSLKDLTSPDNLMVAPMLD
jgi:hypothetical protein